MTEALCPGRSEPADASPDKIGRGCQNFKVVDVEIPFYFSDSMIHIIAESNHSPFGSALVPHSLRRASTPIRRARTIDWFNI